MRWDANECNNALAFQRAHFYRDCTYTLSSLRTSFAFNENGKLEKNLMRAAIELESALNF